MNNTSNSFISFSKSKNKMAIYLAGLILLIIIVAGGFWYSADQSKKTEDKKKQDEKVAMENKKKQEDEVTKKAESVEVNSSSSTIEIATNLTGKNYRATRISLLTSALVFPTGELSFKESGAFSLNVQGLNLAILGNESLKVDGVYPTASGIASGAGLPNKDGKTFDLTVSSLQVQFLVNGNVLDAAKTASINTALTSAGLVIPVVSTQAPILVNVTIVPNSRSLSVKSTPTSTYLISFEGNLI